MFHLYQHHDLTTLTSMLAALRERATPPCPLRPDTVLVPNRGTARWLQAELAEAEGSATNLELSVPAPFVWQVLHGAVPGADSGQYTRERLGWHLHALLPEIDVPEVRRYLAATPPERHRFQLAQQLADVFDQYLIHRRDVLAAWEAGDEDSAPPASWQAPVWRALVARLGALPKARHRARLLADFLALAECGELDVSALPNPVYAFALVDLPADYLRLLHALGRFVDVHFLLPNPSAAYWGDVVRRPVSAGDGQADAGDEALEIEPGHPLLASLGRAGRDFLRVLYSDEFADIQEPELGEAFAYAAPGEGCLLHRVQSGVIAGGTVADDRGIGGGDVSVQVHACHGPVRELQVLHDRLLDLMVREPALEPRGILVLLPDVAAYAPAVQSVFGSASGSRRIPYSVTDRPRLDTHPIAQTFQQLIELPLSRWAASEVLALAGVPAVMRRFGLDDGDFDLLHHWAAESGVRWGLDRQTREAVGAAGFEQNTWRFGLDRLLLGLAQRDGSALVDGVAPWSDLEGGSATAVGRLWLLVDRLRYWRDTLVQAADAGAWHERLNAMADDLFAIDTDDAGESDALEAVFEAVGVLEGAAESLGEDILSWEAVREAMLGALAGPSQRQPLVTGGVTFTGLEPLRGVPFDVICMIGMDDDAFPRQDGQREFNLLRKHPRTGDPSVREADRMAFLQALMAARRCFYVSYTGCNLADGAELQPSPVVGEFLDYLHGYHGAGRNALVTEQPMHPFSPRCFPATANGLFTFDDQWRPTAEAQRGARGAPAPFLDGTLLERPDPIEPVDLAELQRFYRHPPQWFFRTRLRLELDDPGDTLSDEEPRVLDGLEKYALRERLFAYATAAGLGSVDEAPSALERARGRLPPPPLGGADYAEAAAEVNALLPLYRKWQQDADGEADIDIDIELDDGTRVLGRVPGVGAHELRRMRPGSLRLKHLLPWWLTYVAVVACGRDVGLRLAGTADGELIQLAGRIDRAAARDYLRTAVMHFREGHARPLLFECYLAEHYLDQREKTRRATGAPRTPDEALDSTNGYLSNIYQPPHTMRDPWLKPLFGPSPEPLGPDAEHSEFVTLAESLAHPIREHLAAPDEEAPEDETPADEAPEDGAPEDGAPEDGAPEDKTPEDEA